MVFDIRNIFSIVLGVLFAMVAVLTMGNWTDSEVAARDNYLTLAQRAISGKQNDKAALAEACVHFRNAAYYDIAASDAEAALQTCDRAGRMGSAYSSYLMGKMLKTTQGYYRSTVYDQQFTDLLGRSIAAAEWFRRAARDGYALAEEEALKMDQIIAKHQKTKVDIEVGDMLVIGLVIVGVMVSAV